MSIIDKNLVLVASAIVFKEVKDTDLWFVIKSSEIDEWQFPKTVMRKGESSVRGCIRMMGEQGAMTLLLLEEAGRAGGVTTINDKTLPQRHIYYVAKMLSESGEAIGFDETEWLEYAKALRRLTSKREKAMLKQAKVELTKWRKKQAEKKSKLEPEEPEVEVEL